MLIDKATQHSFIATTGGTSNAPQRDYGYISTFRGPAGNSIVIIAGTRDAAVMQAADFSTSPVALRDLGNRINQGQAFEALLQVDAPSDQNLAGKLLSVRPLAAANIWRGGAPQQFPDDAQMARADRGNREPCYDDM